MSMSDDELPPPVTKVILGNATHSAVIEASPQKRKPPVHTKPKTVKGRCEDAEDFEGFIGCYKNWRKNFTAEIHGGMEEAKLMCERWVERVLPRRHGSGCVRRTAYLRRRVVAEAARTGWSELASGNGLASRVGGVRHEQRAAEPDSSVLGFVRAVQLQGGPG